MILGYLNIFNKSSCFKYISTILTTKKIQNLFEIPPLFLMETLF